MLSIETKRKIDNARDVLVGKIPNPQAQIEQITTALIYKFMDDMDEKSKTLGGKARFFVGDFEKYSWRKLLDPRIGGQERMNLYSEAVQSLSQNSALPQIFRDVFKDAFVPYRDPETLSLFLKEINWFDYHHSEELGNAYEYLLSIMSSQGDAGQFRTPRHIIDFIVQAVDPQKDETILDPACGTAGFLISAYKHIVGANDGLDDITGLPTNQEQRLKPEERAKMLKNFHGYDIDPGMVRLSLVNMYLHGFVAPNIEEYDSLTYEDRWNDDFDVILANPPFMTPKGGVRPHKRFQIQANRAEVLFVDYIAEHLKPKGRAGIVVPEGVIFQNSSSGKQLRKYLLDNDLLWAIISLPAGVFLPYSGVKTSILLLDRQRAKENNEILLIDVGADGFSLSSNRTPIPKNDLPKTLDILEKWRSKEKIDDDAASYVSKQLIRDLGHYDFSVGRYAVDKQGTSEFPYVELSSFARIVSGVGFPKHHQGNTDAEYPFLKVSDMNTPGNEVYINFYNNSVSTETLKKLKGNAYPPGTIIFPKIGAAIATNKKRILKQESIFDNNVMGIIPDETKVVPKFLYYLMLYFDLSKWASKSALPSIRKSDVEITKFPLPSIDQQLSIVDEIDKLQENTAKHEKAIQRNKQAMKTKIIEVWGE